MTSMRSMSNGMKIQVKKIQYRSTYHCAHNVHVDDVHVQIVMAYKNNVAYFADVLQCIHCITGTQ